MTDLSDLRTILDRIAAGSHTESDLAALRQLLQVGNQPAVVKLGKYNVHIGERQDIQIGDRIYQGPDAETIRQTIRQTLDEYRLRPGIPFLAPPLPPHFIPNLQVTNALKTRLLASSPITPSTLMISALHGLGGIGKSTLVAALAYDPEVQHRFADGILWATLGQQPDLLSLLNSWIQALGDYDFHPTTIAAASSHLRILLEDKATLMIVDDAWEPEHVRPFQVSGPQGQVLITTRRADIAEEVGAELYQMDVMTPEQSLALLTARLGRPLVEKEQAEALALARDVGYLPLALELAAARVARGIGWASLREALEEEVARLEVLESHRRPGKATLETSFNLSLNALRSEDELAWQAFVWLGVLPEDVRIAAPMAAILWEMDKTEAGDMLELLWNDALLLLTPPILVGEREWPAYRIHNLLHDMARRLLTTPQPQGLGFNLPMVHTILLERYHKYTQEDDLWHTLPDDGYIHTHLTWHLEQAGLVEQIYGLLQEETDEGRNGWYHACEQLGQTDTFLTDINRAWRLVEKEALTTCEPSSPSRETDREWGLTVRYALITAFLNSLGDNLMPEQLLTMIEEGIWPQSPGLTYAPRLRDKEQQTKVLVNLIPSLPDYLTTKEEATREVLVAVRAIKDEYDRTEALVGLASHLSDVERALALSEALEAARAIVNVGVRVRVLSRLAAHLSEELQSEVLIDALAAARAIRDERQRAEALRGLAPRLAVLGYSQEALAAVRVIRDEDERAEALVELAPHLPEGLLAEALAAARSIGDEWRRAEALAGLAPHLLEPRRSPVLAEALAAARSIGDEWRRAEALAALAPYLLEGLLAEALAAARSIGDESERAEALIGLAPHLPEPRRSSVLAEALAAARSIEAEWRRAEALAGLAPHLPEGLLAEALAAARSIGDEWRRAEALAALAPHLPASLSEDVLHEVVKVTLSIEDNYRQGEILKSLVPELIKLPRPVLCAIWQQILHHQSQSQYREFLLNLSIFVPLINHLGGKTAIEETFRAIQDIDYWWRKEPIKQKSLVEWSLAHINLVTSRNDHFWRDWAEHIEQAIVYYQQLLEILTQQESLIERAIVQVNLGAAYRVRTRGKRAENIERAVGYYQQAALMFTQQEFPEQWAAVEVGLAAAYYNYTYGDRVKNLRQALVHFQRSLEVCDRENFSEQYLAILQSLDTLERELSQVQFFVLWETIKVEDIDYRIYQFCTFFSRLTSLTLQTYHAYHSKGVFLGIFNLSSLFQNIPLPATDKFPILFVATESLNVDLFKYIRQKLSKHLGPNNQQALLIPFVKDQALLEAKSLIAGAIKQAYAYDLICLSREEVEQVVVGEEPYNILRKIILSQMDLTRIPVYKPKGTTPDAMFFGRERELLEISTNIALANYILIGGRRIGKTSILKRLERVHLPADGIRALYHECSYTPTQTELVQELITNKAWFSKPPSHKVSSLTEIVQALPDDKPLVILFDEADKLIKPDQQAGYPIFNTLRALSNANRCSFVLCGERALRSELTNPNSPLYNFGKDMLIGRLERYAVEELVTQPMRQLEIDFADEAAIVGRVWEFTSGHPSVVQSLCLQLITRLNQSNSRYLNLEDVEAVVADPNFLRKNFLSVYWEQATILERLCSLMIAADANIHTLTEMQQALSGRGIEVTLNQIDDALERLVDLRNILQRTASGYEFGVTAFPQVIAKTHRLDDLIALNCEVYQQQGDIVPYTKGGV